MTEEQAIERIAKAINALSTERPKVNRWDLGCAEAAWQEMKAIAREDSPKRCDDCGGAGCKLCAYSGVIPVPLISVEEMDRRLDRPNDGAWIRQPEGHHALVCEIA